MKKIKFAALLIAVCLALGLSGTAAADDEIPTLFHNDEAWYKDGVAPLIERDDIYYVPAELFGMFENISVTTPTGNNLLIANTKTGGYVSILFMERTAAINGKIVEDIHIFRDNGIYYVEAAEVADTVDILYELITHENGHVSMRLYDENCMLTTTELISPYLPEEETDDEFTESDSDEDNDLKHIFVICREPSQYASFSVLDMLRQYNMGYTLFLDENTTTESLLEACADGVYGILTENVGEEAVQALNEMNEKFGKITRFKTHLTLSTGSYDSDDLLRSSAYCPVTPDFIVTNVTDSDVMFADMMQYLGENEYCVLMLEDCWASERMISLMNEINREKYITSNLGN